MNYHVLTVFPEMIDSGTSFGVVGQARKDGLISVEALSPRTFTSNVHQTIDDRPFGGGDGMVMLAEPLSLALESILSRTNPLKRRIIHLSPRGTPLSDKKVRELAENHQELVLIASRYGGVDQRFLNEYVDEEISIGDYVVSGGELPALILIDAVSRMLPGVLGNELSSDLESFADGVLEYPQFTRPREWRGQEVPQVLLSGHHKEIAAWKRALAILITAERRPDLLKTLSRAELEEARKLFDKMSQEERLVLGLKGKDCQ